MSEQAPRHEQDPHHAPIGYEPFGTSTRGILVGLFGVVALVIVAAFAMDLLLDFLAPAVKQPDTLGRHPQPPKLQSEPPVDQNQPEELRELREQAEKLLSSYAWIDEQQGLARIPIERAMEIFVNQHAGESEASTDAPSDETPAAQAVPEADTPRPPRVDGDSSPSAASPITAPPPAAPDHNEILDPEDTP